MPIFEVVMFINPKLSQAKRAGKLGSFFLLVSLTSGGLSFLNASDGMPYISGLYSIIAGYFLVACDFQDLDRDINMQTRLQGGYYKLCMGIGEWLGMNHWHDENYNKFVQLIGLNEVKSPPATGSQRLTERPQGFAYQSENLDANRELKRNNQGPSSKDPGFK